MVCLFWMTIRPAHIENQGAQAVVVNTVQPQTETTVVYTQQQPAQQYTYAQQTQPAYTQQQPGYAPLNGQPNYGTQNY